jgi:tetratricopeptide (TPR) repeat protein
MRLCLSFPEPWITRETSVEDRIALLADGADVPQLVVTFGPIVILPAEVGPWIDEMLAKETPAGSRLERGAMVEHETAAGWEMRLVEAEVVTGEGKVVEARWCAFYRFMEHAAVATVRAASRAKLDEQRAALVDILRSGRPDWRGEQLCVVELWDLDPPRRAVASEVVEAQLVSGEILEQRGQPAEALSELEAAAARAPEVARAHHLIGVALHELGRVGEAMAAWGKALALDPTMAEACYRLAKTCFQQGQLDEALAGFRKTCALEPMNLFALRDYVRALHAVGRLKEGEVARTRFRARWAESPDRRARLLDEYCFDAYDRGGMRVEVFETLRPRDPRRATIFTFRTVDAGGRPLAVCIEASEVGRRSGQPYTIAVIEDDCYRVLGTTYKLPPYAELRATADQLLAGMARPCSGTNPAS